MNQGDEPVALYAAGSDGVWRCEQDCATGELSGPTRVADHALQWLVISHDGRRVYGGATLEGADSATDGAVAAFAVESDGSLTFINQLPSRGKTTCYVDVDRFGQLLVGTSFRFDTYPSRGSFGAWRLDDGGAIGEQVGRFEHPGKGGSDSDRQLASHPHSAVFHPSGDYVAVADLGVDAVFLYRVDRSPDGAKLGLACEAKAEPAQQPRHLAWHPNGRRLYCMNEVAPTVSVLEFNASPAELRFVQHEGRLAPGVTESGGADLVMHPTGRFVYGSNRGCDDIVAFAIDAEAGKLLRIGHVPAGGANTRSMTISPDGRWLIAANQGSDVLRVFGVDQTKGTLIDTGVTQRVALPACVKSVSDHLRR